MEPGTSPSLPFPQNTSPALGEAEDPQIPNLRSGLWGPEDSWGSVACG